MSISVYSGEDIYREEENLHEYLKKYSIMQDQIYTIEASNSRTFQLERALLECDTMSLFSESRKAVILKNPFFLNASYKESEVKETKKKSSKETKKEQRLRLLEEYLKNPNTQTLLIFYCHGFKADSRKKEYKLLQKYGAEFIEFTKMDDKEFRIYAKKELQKGKYTLTKEAEEEFYLRVGTDTMLLHNAVDKLNIYGRHDLDLEDIRHLVSLNPDVNIFRLTSAFIKGDLAECQKAGEEMLNAGFDYQGLIALIAKRLRTVYNIKKLHELGLSDEQTAVRMHLNKKGSIYYVLKEVQYLSAKTILRQLKELADLDQNIKQGNISPRDGYEQFILKNGQRNYAGNKRTF